MDPVTLNDNADFDFSQPPEELITATFSSLLTPGTPEINDHSLPECRWHFLLSPTATATLSHFASHRRGYVAVPQGPMGCYML